MQRLRGVRVGQDVREEKKVKMTRWWMCLVALVFASSALGQATDTPTPTPTPVNTLLPRAPQMVPVATAFPRGVGFQIVRDMVCPAPPCSSAVVPVTAGHKSLQVEVVGLASVDVVCRISALPDPNRGPVSLIETVTQTAPVEFERWCDELSIRVTSCIACQVSAWVRAG